MKKMILIALLFAGCKEGKDEVQAFYMIVDESNCTAKEAEAMQKENFAKFTRLFEICMKGQRHTTGTDDADDFVKACKEAAESQGRNCGINSISKHYFLLKPADTDDCKLSWTSRSYRGNCILCREVVTEAHKKLCADAGYKEEKK